MPIKILSNPLITHKLTQIRDKNTTTRDFQEIITEIGSLMTYEASNLFPVKKVEIETPICKTTQEVISCDITIVPILRAGLGMVNGVRNMIPNAKVGFIGLSRDEETLKPIKYYSKLNRNISDTLVILVDPMLATAGSAIEALNILKAEGCKNIIYLGIVAAPEGIEALQKAHPDVNAFVAALDEKLNEKGYIVPGLGDCGDRLFGTK